MTSIASAQRKSHPPDTVRNGNREGNFLAVQKNRGVPSQPGNLGYRLFPGQQTCGSRHFDANRCRKQSLPMDNMIVISKLLRRQRGCVTNPVRGGVVPVNQWVQAPVVRGLFRGHARRYVGRGHVDGNFFERIGRQGNSVGIATRKQRFPEQRVALHIKIGQQTDMFQVFFIGEILRLAQIVKGLIPQRLERRFIVEGGLFQVLVEVVFGSSRIQHGSDLSQQMIDARCRKSRPVGKMTSSHEQGMGHVGNLTALPVCFQPAFELNQPGPQRIRRTGGQGDRIGGRLDSFVISGTDRGLPNNQVGIGSAKAVAAYGGLHRDAFGRPPRYGLRVDIKRGVVKIDMGIGLRKMKRGYQGSVAHA